MKKIIVFIGLVTVFLSFSSQALEVNITRDLASVEVTHQGKKVQIMRNQDEMSTITPDFMLTSRPCPPFCVQPMQLAPGVETIGELEVLDYLQRKESDDSILVIDSRTADWVAKGSIPGSINIPWNTVSASAGADPMSITEILTEQFGVREQEGLFDFSAAKTLVLFCNGAWCGQSPANIRTLLKYGYPADKIKWYRGGMQAWYTFGLSTTAPE